ncbi:MAG: type IV secretory system conjugative DNA transfer family protein [Chloroflexota bacterium]
MTMYRNRDVRRKTPIANIAMYAVMGVLGYFFFKPLFPNPMYQYAVGGACALLFAVVHQLWMWSPARMRKANRFAIEEYRKEQGRLTFKEAKKAGLVVKGPSLPLASLEKSDKLRSTQMIGMPMDKLEGHTLVVGATRSGKGMHLTRTLYEADCAMIVVDPKGEQRFRTAAYRAEHVGPIYTIPGNTLDLARYFDLGQNDHLTELHFHLLKPWADKQPIFGEKAKFLFAAAHSYAADHGLNPMMVLLDAANSAPATTLEELRKSDYDNVMNFTNGDEPDNLDKFAASSWGNFATRMFDYQQHWHTLTTGNNLAAIPLNWAEEKATIYITYPFDVLKGVSGAVSGMISALLRYQKMNDRKDRIIAAVDELPVVGLRNVSEYLATVGGYNISLLLYVQTYSQLSKMYGERDAETILSNCHHQVWYPPSDIITAKRMSELFGTKLEPLQAYSHKDEDKAFIPDLGIRTKGRSVSLQYRPALTPEEMVALPKDHVICQIDRRHVIRAYRLWPVPEFRNIVPPPYEIEVDATRAPAPWGPSFAAPVVRPDDVEEAFFDPTE